MNYQIDPTHYNSIFAVPTSVVDQHLRLCGALQLKALLLLLRHASQCFSAEELAERLGVSPGDARDALQYWISSGLVRTGEDAAPRPQAPDPQPKPAPAPAAVRELPLTQEENGRKVVLVSDRPRLDREEALALIERDQTLAQLIQEAQTTLKKPLTHTDCDTIVALYSYYGLPADFILMVLGYCQSIGKGNLRYVEKTAAGWVNDGIDTLEKAEEHIRLLSRRSTNEEKVRTAFGIGARALITNEKRYISAWFDDYGFDLDIIRLAYERTIEQIGELRFPYLHKILTSWHEKGIRTAKEAVQEMAARKGNAAPPPANSSFNAQELQDRILKDFMK